jgi:hypothetical protein
VLKGGSSTTDAKGEALVPIHLHRLGNQYKWNLQTGANAPVSTSGTYKPVLNYNKAANSFLKSELMERN